DGGWKRRADNLVILDGERGFTNRIVCTIRDSNGAAIGNHCIGFRQNWARQIVRVNFTDLAIGFWDRPSDEIAFLDLRIALAVETAAGTNRTIGNLKAVGRLA